MIPELKERILKDYTEEEYNRIVEGYNSNRPVTIRINNLKSTKENVFFCLSTKLSRLSIHLWRSILVF